jgi:hypothetical protein
MPLVTRGSLFGLLGVCLLIKPAVAPASAEIVFFKTGRAMSIAGHETDGASIVLFLRNGGEVVAHRSLIDRIAPDELPVSEDPRTEVTALRQLEARLEEARRDAALAVAAAAGRPYADIIARVSAEHGVDPLLVHALIEVESGYRPDARSPKGAMGLMQLMPETAARYSVQDPFDPAANIRAGTRHLKSLLDKFDIRGALAAYNAGEGPVRKFQGIPPYQETQNYVSRILRIVSPRD